MTVLVLVEERPTAGVRHTVRAGSTIGREGCDVTLADDEVSRRHACIREVGASWGIEDLGSTNGTFVGGRRITGIVELHDGDEIAVGTALLTAEVVGERRAETRAAAPAAAPPTTARATQAGPPTAESAPAGGGQSRGDVPAPAPASASRVHQTLAPVAAPPRAEFRPEAGSTASRRGSAATRTEATLISYGVVLATAAGIVAYLIGRA